jgi:hypothetical protein
MLTFVGDFAQAGFQQHLCLFYGDANTDVLFMGQQETKAKSK